MRTLLIDIETTPNLAHVWGLFHENIGINQIIEPTEMLCFAAKWLDQNGTHFYSVHGDGKDSMISWAHMLLSAADVVMHYNGKTFDVPHLNREFVQAGLKPPAPFEQIDLLEVVKKRFRFPSNKLDYVSRALGLPGKVHHEGHELWIKCMAGDPDAWRRMEEYNRQDVKLLEQLYEILQPWVPKHPSHAAYTGEHVCPACGSSDLTKQGFAYTSVAKYQRYSCGACGKWSRGSRRIDGVQIREVAA